MLLEVVELRLIATNPGNELQKRELGKSIHLMNRVMLQHRAQEQQEKSCEQIALSSALEMQIRSRLYCHRVGNVISIA